MAGAKVQHIPQALVYEMVDGKPIYYKGYKEYLDNSKPLDEVMGSSLIQSLIITQLIILLGSKLGKKYSLLTNEVGLQFSKNSWRSADIAIVEKSKVKAQKDQNKYLEFAPEVVIEIDVKASIDEISDSYGYFHKKTDQLLDFGVKKVVWIFTDSAKIMIAEKNKPWQTFDWNNSFTLWENIEIDIERILNENE